MSSRAKRRVRRNRSACFSRPAMGFCSVISGSGMSAFARKLGGTRFSPADSVMLTAASFRVGGNLQK